jgi:hypothetical protein
MPQQDAAAQRSSRAAQRQPSAVGAADFSAAMRRSISSGGTSSTCVAIVQT